jgi:hypothetical protein
MQILSMQNVDPRRPRDDDLLPNTALDLYVAFFWLRCFRSSSQTVVQYPWCPSYRIGHVAVFYFPWVIQLAEYLWEVSNMQELTQRQNSMIWSLANDLMYEMAFLSAVPCDFHTNTPTLLCRNVSY